MQTNPISVGILSFGMSGQLFHAPFIDNNERFRLKAVVERSTKKAHALYPNMLSYDTVDELLADQTIELVVVNTPSHTHLELATQALQAGKHVLLEKPAVENVKQLEALLATSKRYNKQLFFYQNRRFDSHYQSVKEVVESGLLGKLVEVHFRYDRYKLELGVKAFKEDATYPTSGLVYDLGPHLLDQAIALFGRPARFVKTTGIHRPESSVVDYFNYQLIYNDGLRVFLTSSLVVADPQVAYTLHGISGSFSKKFADVQERQLQQGMKPNNPFYGIENEGDEGRLVTISADGAKRIEYIKSPKGDYGLLFDAVYESLRKGFPYPITAEHIRVQTELLEAESFGG